MLVKIFEAEEMSSALKLVKEKLGPDALILSTRTLRKGGMGLFGKSVLEVTAAVESPALGAPRRAVAVEPEPEFSYRDIWRRSTVVDPSEPVEETRVPAKDTSGEELATVRAEMHELKEMLRRVAQDSRPRRDPDFSRSYAPAGGAEGLQHLLSELGRWGIEGEAADTIIHGARENLTESQLCDPSHLQSFLREALGAMARVTGPIFAPGGEQQRIAMIGPTGVGKTTTLAKLAADYLTRFDGKVALVTIDTYRIAAVEQLKVYGEILCVPVEVVFSPEELQEAFARHADKDLILVDTAGRSPRDEQSLDELTAFLGPESGTSRHLVLSAPTRNRELRETVRRFGRLPLDSIIFTKLDECEERGALLNIPVHGNLPVSYLTNGQRVPEDLLTAEPSNITDYIMVRS